MSSSSSSSSSGSDTAEQHHQRRIDPLAGVPQEEEEEEEVRPTEPSPSGVDDSPDDDDYDRFMEMSLKELKQTIADIRSKLPTVHPNAYKSKYYESPDEIEETLTDISEDLEGDGSGPNNLHPYMLDRMADALRAAQRFIEDAAEWPMEPVDLVKEYAKQRDNQRMTAARSNFVKSLGVFKATDSLEKEKEEEQTEQDTARLPAFSSSKFEKFFAWDAPSLMAAPPSLLPRESDGRKTETSSSTEPPDPPPPSLESLRQQCKIHASLLPGIHDSTIKAEAEGDFRLAPALTDKYAEVLATAAKGKAEGKVDPMVLRTELNPELAAKRVSVMLESTCISMYLKNPLDFVGPGAEVGCDSCSSGMTVAYQVQESESETGRDKSNFFSGGFGFDQCLVCGVYYFQMCKRNLREFVSSSSWDGVYDDVEEFVKKATNTATTRTTASEEDEDVKDQASQQEVDERLYYQDQINLLQIPNKEKKIGDEDARSWTWTTDSDDSDDYTRRPKNDEEKEESQKNIDMINAMPEKLTLHSPVSFTPQSLEKRAGLKPGEYYENPFCQGSALRVQDCNFSKTKAGHEKLAAAVTVSVAPRGAHLIAWFSHDAADNLPPKSWRKFMRISVDGLSSEPTRAVSMVYNQSFAADLVVGAAVKESNEGEEDDDDDGGAIWAIDKDIHHGHAVGECSLCLEVLDLEEGDCMQTKCRHWFHVKCLQRWTREPSQASSTPHCPLCRAENPLEKEDLTTLLSENVYRLTVRSVNNYSQEEQQDGNKYLFVGVIISNDGKYHNETDIGALQSLEVCL